VNKFDKLYYTGMAIIASFILIVLMIMTMYIKHKLNEPPVYTKPIEIEQHVIIRDTVFIERNKVKKHYKSPISQPTIEIKQPLPQTTDTTKI